MICRGMCNNGSEEAGGGEGTDSGMTQRVHGARGRLGGHAPKSRTRSIMVSSLGGNVAGDGEVVDDNVAYKAGAMGDNGGMTCGAKVSRGGVETLVVWKSWKSRGGVEYFGEMEVSSVE